MNFYTYFKQKAEAVLIFNESMKEKTKEWITPFFEGEDFSEVKIIVDVGGNIDTLTAVILKANAKMQAILVDREDVVVGANQVLDVAGVLDRCQLLGEKNRLSSPRSLPLLTLSRPS